jgi:hypothetical protein
VSATHVLTMTGAAGPCKQNGRRRRRRALRGTGELRRADARRGARRGDALRLAVLDGVEDLALRRGRRATRVRARTAAAPLRQCIRFGPRRQLRQHCGRRRGRRRAERVDAEPAVQLLVDLLREKIEGFFFFRGRGHRHVLVVRADVPAAEIEVELRDELELRGG